LAVGAAGASFFSTAWPSSEDNLLSASGLAQLSNNTLPALQHFGLWVLASMAAHQTKRLLPDSGLCGTFELAGPILGW
jgi:hypothetical protein